VRFQRIYQHGWARHTEAEKANTGIAGAFTRPLLTSYTLSSPSDAKTFPDFRKKWKLDLSSLKIILGSEEFPKIFLLLRYLQPAEGYN
jgi:hypothetical protein